MRFQKSFLGVAFFTLAFAMAIATLVMTAHPSQGRAAAVPGDPLIGLYFGLEGDGLEGGFFTSCHGMGSTTETIEHKIVDPDGVERIRKVPGRTTFNDVICTRGLTSNTVLPDWRVLVERGDVAEARRNLTLTAYDRELTPIATWMLESAWPGEYRVVGSPNQALEVIRIVADSVARTQ